MKNIIDDCFVAILALIMIVVILLFTLNVTNTKRHINGKIVAHYTDNSIYMTTEDGNGWNIDVVDVGETLIEDKDIDMSTLIVGANVEIEFKTLGTANIYDDVITNIIVK